MAPFNQKGNVIIFAVAAITAMSITASALTFLSIIEVRRSVNVERSVIARYAAESGIENALFILQRAFDADKSLTEIKDIFEFVDTSKFGETISCTSGVNIIDDCSTLRLSFGLPSINVDFERNNAFTLNIYDPGDKNKSPFQPKDYDIDKVMLQWDNTLPIDNEFEVSLLGWEVSGGKVDLRVPVKRFVDDESNSTDLTDGSISNGIAVMPFPSCTDFDSEYCDGFGASQALFPVLGKIRIRLLEPAEAEDVKVSLYNNTSSVCDFTTQVPTQCVPGYVEIISTGEARVGSNPVNRQAIRVVSSFPTEEQTRSVIWDFVIFSDRSIAK
jgi:hypothetical protein